MKRKILFLIYLSIASLLISTKAWAISATQINNLGNIDPKVLELGMRAYNCAIKMGKASRDEVLTIIDYSKPSSEKRLWIVDIEKKKITSEQLVAHGSGSGEHKSTRFSNKNNSHQSSIGVFRTAESYGGKHGLSLRLDGLEKGINDKARSRNIVIHSAHYVSNSFLDQHGRLGRSWGCPAVEPKKIKETIHKIKGGSVVVAYYPDQQWMKKSEFLHC